MKSSLYILPLLAVLLTGCFDPFGRKPSARLGMHPKVDSFVKARHFKLKEEKEGPVTNSKIYIYEDSNPSIYNKERHDQVMTMVDQDNQVIAIGVVFEQRKEDQIYIDSAEKIVGHYWSIVNKENPILNKAPLTKDIELTKDDMEALWIVKDGRYYVVLNVPQKAWNMLGRREFLGLKPPPAPKPKKKKKRKKTSVDWD